MTENGFIGSKEEEIRNKAVRQFSPVSCLETKDAGTKIDKKRIKVTD
jgi:hypothetical protein